MLSKLLPIIFLLVGAGAGIGAAVFTAPSASEGAEAHAEEAEPAETTDELTAKPEFVKLANQFVVPVVKDDRITSMVVVSLSLEILAGQTDAVYAHEPKLRDIFLRVLFDHANMGGFRGAFTQSESMGLLRGALREAAKKEMSDSIIDVLIVDIARQDT